MLFALIGGSLALVLCGIIDNDIVDVSSLTGCFVLCLSLAGCITLAVGIAWMVVANGWAG